MWYKLSDTCYLETNDITELVVGIKKNRSENNIWSICTAQYDKGWFVNINGNLTEEGKDAVKDNYGTVEEFGSQYPNSKDWSKVLYLIHFESFDPWWYEIKRVYASSEDEAIEALMLYMKAHHNFKEVDYELV